MDDVAGITNNTILESLSLNPVTSSASEKEENRLLPCMFCDYTEKFVLNTENKEILQHMFMEHRIVIADVQEVADLESYLEFWKKEFKG
jgi:hypothetical protein